jgi:hypothetical protein
LPRKKTELPDEYMPKEMADDIQAIKDWNEELLDMQKEMRAIKMETNI